MKRTRISRGGSLPRNRKPLSPISDRAGVVRSFRDNLFESALGLMLLSLLYGWDVWPRWMMLAMGWLAVVVSSVCAVIGGVWLLYSDRRPSS